MCLTLGQILVIKTEFGFDLIEVPNRKYHAIILTVAHKEFLNQDLSSHLVEGGILYKY